MKKKILLGLLLSIILSYIMRTTIGSWLTDNYEYTTPFFGPENPQNLEGFLFAYIFFASFLITLISGKLKQGFYFSLPVLIFMSAFKTPNPNLWLSLLLFMVGLGLAWGILFVKKQIAK